MMKFKIKIKHPPFSTFNCYVDDVLLNASSKRITESEFEFDSQHVTHVLRIVRKNIYSSWRAYFNIFNIFLFFANWKFSTTRNLSCDEQYVAMSYTIKKCCIDNGVSVVKIAVHNKENWDNGRFIGNSLEPKVTLLEGVNILNSRREKMPSKDIKRWKFVNIVSTVFFVTLILACLIVCSFDMGFNVVTLLAMSICIVYAISFSKNVFKAKPFEAPGRQGEDSPAA